MRKEERRNNKESRTRRPKQVPFHSRPHRNFLLFAWVETPHFDKAMKTEILTCPMFRCSFPRVQLLHLIMRRHAECSKSPSGSIRARETLNVQRETDRRALLHHTQQYETVARQDLVSALARNNEAHTNNVQKTS